MWIEAGLSPVLLGFFGGMGMQEMAIIGVVAILLFGKNLPGVARNLGQQYAQFRKGLTDIQSEFHNATREVENLPQNGYSSKSSSRSYDDYDDFEEASAPRFEPPPATRHPEQSESH